MFNKGDLVRVRSSSIINYSIHNRINKFPSYTTRSVQYLEDPEMDMKIEYRKDPILYPDPPIGEITSHVRKAFYVVQLKDSMVICFPDELELVYTV